MQDDPQASQGTAKMREKRKKPNQVHLPTQLEMCPVCRSSIRILHSTSTGDLEPEWQCATDTPMQVRKYVYTGVLQQQKKLWQQRQQTPPGACLVIVCPDIDDGYFYPDGHCE